jgi:hypothetical protein
MGTAVGRAEHGTVEGLASCIKGGMEGVALEEKLVKDLVAVLLIYVPSMVLSPDIFHTQ